MSLSTLVLKLRWTQGHRPTFWVLGWRQLALHSIGFVIMLSYWVWPIVGCVCSWWNHWFCRSWCLVHLFTHVSVTDRCVCLPLIENFVRQRTLPGISYVGHFVPSVTHVLACYTCLVIVKAFSYYAIRRAGGSLEVWRHTSALPLIQFTLYGPIGPYHRSTGAPTLSGGGLGWLSSIQRLPTRNLCIKHSGLLLLEIWHTQTGCRALAWYHWLVIWLSLCLVVPPLLPPLT